MHRESRPGPTEASPGPAVRERIPALDGLRGLAIMMVVWHNTFGFSGVGGKSTAAKLFFASANAGWAGVTLFFVLSGFLITGILLDLRGRPRALPTFALRRMLRIFPLYLTTLIVGFVVLPALHALPSWLEQDHRDQALYWTYLINWGAPFGRGGPGFGHFWSLAVEEQFYLLWPLAALYVAPRRLAAICLALVVTAIAGRALMLAFLVPTEVAEKAVYSFTIARWDALAAGGLVAIAMRDIEWQPVVRRLAVRATAVALALLVGLAVLRHGLFQFDHAVQTIGYTLVAAAFAGLLALSLDRSLGGPRWWYDLLEHRWMRAVGTYSYAIYVFHFFLAHVLVPKVPRPLVESGSVRLALTLTVLAIGIFAASLGAALISWRVLEKPFLDLRPKAA